MADLTKQDGAAAGCEKPLTIFSRGEKDALAGLSLTETNLDHVEFLGANLRNASFRNVSLVGCDFMAADLRGAQFVGCDLRQARFAGAILGHNRFDGSWFIAATGLAAARQRYVAARGGRFLTLIRGGRLKRWR